MNERLHWLIRLHWVIFNIMARLFGLMAGIVAIGFLFWGLGIYKLFSIRSDREVEANSIIYICIGILLLVLHLLFIFVSPYRPDIDSKKTNMLGGVNKVSWWTGELRKDNSSNKQC